MTTDLVFAAILVAEVIGFWYFYQTKNGCKAVYHAWYAWIIDCLGIASGTFLMWLAVLFLDDARDFFIPMREAIAFVLFVIGSWQAVIHAVKWAQRIHRV